MRSSADDDLATALRGAADATEAAVALARPASLTVIDGRSGAGKSGLAAELVRRSRGLVQLVALDDLYPGWDGLAAGADEAFRRIIEPHAAGRPGLWRRWDWTRSTWAEEHTVDPSRPLVIEGSGALTPESAALADVTVWLESPLASRKRRALDRDGDTYRPHWERWALQEADHLNGHRPRELAALVFELP